MLGAVLAAMASPAFAQNYPNRNVEIIVPYGPGGSTDIVARIVAQKLQEKLGQNVVVLNKPGASGTLGITTAMRAPPDGYTLVNSYTAEAAIVPQISKTHKYSVLEEFAPIAITGLVPVVLMVSKKNIQANTLKEFIAEVQANPGKFTFGGGIGSPPHVMGAWMTGCAASTCSTCPIAAARRASTTWSAATSRCSTAAPPPERRRSIPVP
jgi:tripartite-type tricarboxylate transporter receptor subunit TctC